jgi:hypothetical protein
MIEINRENPLWQKVRPCRRIVLEEGVDPGSIDPNWSRKIWNKDDGSEPYIVLRNSRTQVPKGFKITEEHKDGEIIPGEPEERIAFKDGKIFLGPHVRVHTCKKRGNDANGMWYRYEPLEGAEMKEF